MYAVALSWIVLAFPGGAATAANVDVSQPAVGNEGLAAPRPAQRLLRLAADKDSWLCQYFPKYCANEGSPGGLPGAAAGGSGSSSDSDSSSSRGMEPDAMRPESAPPAAPSPTPAPAPNQEEKPGSEPQE
jgi:hypothetical protein